jgi:hypothetical protein
MQGYHISKPLLPVDFEQLLSKQRD